MWTAIDVSEYFLSLVNESEGDFLTNLKIQKLLYYAQGVNLAVLGTPLFKDEIVAWSLGPVVVGAYEHYKRFGADPVRLPDDFNPQRFEGKKFSPAQKELLGEVFTVYGQFSASALVRMTHNEPPWKNTPVGSVINREKLQEYFRTQVYD